MGKRLLVLAGPDEGRVFNLGAEPLLLGRSRATETQLIDPHVARVHCQVQWQGDQCVVSDFDSEGGTYLNGVRIGEQAARPGDIIRVGNTRLQYLDDEAGSTPVSAAPTPVQLADGEKLASAVSVASLVGGWAKQLTGQRFGQFQIGPLLARGNIGYIFHARHVRKNIDVVLKVLNPGFGSNEKLVQRFVAGMKTVLPLKHPNLIRVHAAGKTGLHCWVAMEYVRGESLAAIIGRIAGGGKVDWRSVLRILIYMSRALVYAHGKKIIHECITPQNILVARDLSQTKLLDLMLDVAIDRDPTVPVGPAGEPSDALAYMSPERTDGPGMPIDVRTDIYSLGAAGHAMFTGQPPFQADTARELVTKIRLQAPPSLKPFGIPDALELINMKMLAKRPQDRQQSAKELLTDLEQISEANGVAA